MFLKINDFFACQGNNSLFFMFIEFRKLFASIHKVTLKIGMGLYKEDQLLQCHSQQYEFIRMGLGTRCVQLWIGSTEQPGEQCYENGLFCLLITYCQHPQSVNKIITTVNSGPVIG